MRYKHVLLDFDGTLLDSRKVERFALTRTFEEFNLKINGDIIEAYHLINISYWQRFEAGEISEDALKHDRIAELLNGFGIPLPDLEQFNNAYIGYARNNAPTYEGTLEVLQKLERVSRLSMITNGFTKTQNWKIAAAGIGDYFEKVFIAQEMGVRKPQRAFFDYVHKTLGEPEVSEMLVVGDSLMADIKGGNDYQIDTCWFNPERLPNTTDVTPVYEIDNLEKILWL